MDPVLTMDGWSCILHYDKEGNPIWFSYYVWGYFLQLSIQFAKDLSLKFGKQLEIYDLFGTDGQGTAKIRIISDSLP